MKKSPFRYNFLQKLSKKAFRRLFPVPQSPWTKGDADDICKIHLVPPEVLESFFEKNIRLLKKIKGDNTGDYLEFGVFNGSSIGSMYRAAGKAGLDIRYFGFDSFQGLPEEAEKEDCGVWKKGFYACSFEKMCACLREREIEKDNIVWIEGWYQDTLNEETALKHEIDNIGIVFIDCDTYSSSKAVLDFLAPLIKKPVIMCLDDWKLNDLDIKGMGEYKSFNEFLEQNTHLRAKEMKSYNRKSRTFLITPG